MDSKGRIGYRASVAAGIAALMVLGAAAVPASAAPPGDVTVKFGDLDLNTARGAATLYSRIKTAAEQACPGADSLFVPRHLAALRCENAAVADAVATVSNPKLAALYAERARHGRV